MWLLKLKCHGLQSIASPYRYYSLSAVRSMRAWQAFQYGNPEDLQISTTAKIPIISRAKDILVKVHASSVNPLDVMMLQGYGATMIGAFRQVYNWSCTPQEFPLTLGRDFSGTVVGVGKQVKDIKCGDEIWGVIGPQESGSHADYVTTSVCSVSKKPQTLSHIEASSMPYAALTAWSAICTFGELPKDSAFGKRVLVFGGSGGVGTLAIQMLKSWGAEVTATCSSDAVEMVQNLGADHVIDYQIQDVRSELRQDRRFDLILDTVGGNNKEFALDLLKKWQNKKYITIVSPLLKNADQNGLLLGTLKSAAQAAWDSALGFRDGKNIRWAFFVPNSCALKTISSMVDNKKMSPVIDEIFNFEETPKAYRKLLDGHARGKIVIDNTGKSVKHVADFSVEHDTDSNVK